MLTEKYNNFETNQTHQTLAELSERAHKKQQII